MGLQSVQTRENERYQIDWSVAIFADFPPSSVALRDFITSSPGLRSQIRKVEDVSQ